MKILSENRLLGNRGWTLLREEGLTVVCKPPLQLTLIHSNRYVSGVESTYVWEGKVETEAEFLLLIKTQQVDFFFISGLARCHLINQS